MQPRTETISLEHLRLTAVVAAAVAAGLLAWLLLRDGKDEKQSAKASAPVAASVSDLKALPSSVGHDVYWAGTKRGYTYELSRTSRGDIFIRYLPRGMPVGDRSPNFLTVGTYPHPNAFATVRKASKRPGAITRPIAGGGLAVSNRSLPGSVYFAYPDSDLLQEVYDRSPKRALALATSGRVRPIRRSRSPGRSARG
jgi:hypothetical protein